MDAQFRPVHWRTYSSRRINLRSWEHSVDAVRGQARLVALEWGTPFLCWPHSDKLTEMDRTSIDGTYWWGLKATLNGESHHWSSLEVRYIRHWRVFIVIQWVVSSRFSSYPTRSRCPQRPSPGTELSPWKVCVYTSVVCFAVSLVYSKFVLGPLGFIDTILPLIYCCDRPRVQMSYNTLKSSKVFVSRANHMSTCTKSTQSTFLSVSVLESILVVV